MIAKPTDIYCAIWNPFQVKSVLNGLNSLYRLNIQPSIKKLTLISVLPWWIRMVSHQWRRFAFFSKEVVKDDNGEKWAGLQVLVCLCVCLYVCLQVRVCLFVCLLLPCLSICVYVYVRLLVLLVCLVSLFHVLYFLLYRCLFVS